MQSLESLIPVESGRCVYTVKNMNKMSKKPRPRNEIWDSICKSFAMTDLSKTSQTRIGKVTRDLKARGIDPDEIPIRLAILKGKFPTWPLYTPEALEKHWDACKPVIISAVDKTADYLAKQREHESTAKTWAEHKAEAEA